VNNRSSINEKAAIATLKHLSIVGTNRQTHTFTCCGKLKPKPQKHLNGMERSNSQVLDLSCSLPQIKTSYARSLLRRTDRDIISSSPLVCPFHRVGHAGSHSTSHGYRCCTRRLSGIHGHLHHHRRHQSDPLFHPFFLLLFHC